MNETVYGPSGSGLPVLPQLTSNVPSAECQCLNLDVTKTFPLSRTKSNQFRSCKSTRRRCSLRTAFLSAGIHRKEDARPKVDLQRATNVGTFRRRRNRPKQPRLQTMRAAFSYQLTRSCLYPGVAFPAWRGLIISGFSTTPSADAVNASRGDRISRSRTVAREQSRPRHADRIALSVPSLSTGTE